MAGTSSLASSNAGTLDVPSLVAQLMTVERMPIEKLSARVASYQTKISSFGTLKGLVSSFQTALQRLGASMQGFSATASDATVLSAAATSTAAAGSYAIDVTTLARAHSLAGAGQLSDAAAIATVDSTVTFTVGTTSTSIAITAGATLQDIRGAINAANIGVTATIVNDGSAKPYRIALSAASSGTSNAINSITVQTGGDAAINDLLAYNPTENVPAPLVPMAQTVAAADADFTVNGIRILKSANTITDAIPGVALTLARENAQASLTVKRDGGSVDAAAAAFVDAFNALSSQLKSRSAFGSSAEAAPVLAGDGTVRLMLDQLRGILMAPATGGTLTTLSQVGIGFQADGSLKLDSAKLGSALTHDFGDVVNLFSSATGYATRLDAWASSVTQAGGLINTRTDSLNTFVKGYNEQIEKLENRMVFLQKQYTTTYSNLNALLNNMNKTGAYLAQQFSSSSN